MRPPFVSLKGQTFLSRRVVKESDKKRVLSFSLFLLIALHFPFSPLAGGGGLNSRFIRQVRPFLNDPAGSDGCPLRGCGEEVNTPIPPCVHTYLHIQCMHITHGHREKHFLKPGKKLV